MLSLILSAFLGVSATCNGVECTNGLSLQIDFVGIIQPSNSLSIEVWDISTEHNGLVRVDIEYSTSGESEPKNIKQSYLLVDRLEKADHDMVMVHAESTGIRLDVPPTVYVMDWPKGWNTNEVIAFYRIVRDTRKRI